MSKEGRDELLTRQIEAVISGLLDQCPSIRTVSITGCFELLDRFWELLPSNITAGFLKRLLGEITQ